MVCDKTSSRERDSSLRHLAKWNILLPCQNFLHHMETFDAVVRFSSKSCAGKCWSEKRIFWRSHDDFSALCRKKSCMLGLKLSLSCRFSGPFELLARFLQITIYDWVCLRVKYLFRRLRNTDVTVSNLKMSTHNYGIILTDCEFQKLWNHPSEKFWKGGLHL